MQITHLKQQLDILQVAQTLGVEMNKSKVHCPFHHDKTPSLQFSKEKQIATCFSSNCDAGTTDVISLVQKYQAWEMKTPLEWLQESIGIMEIKPIKEENAVINRVEVLTELLSLMSLN